MIESKLHLRYTRDGIEVAAAGVEYPSGQYVEITEGIETLRRPASAEERFLYPEVVAVEAPPAPSLEDLVKQVSVLSETLDLLIVNSL